MAVQAVQAIGFFGMLKQVYGAISAIASAVGRGANALDNLGQWAEEQTATFVDEARVERQAKIEELNRKLLAVKQQNAIEVNAN